VLALADASGAVATEYAYEPFGATMVTGASSQNAAQFTGRENDGTGLYYYRARYYHPELPRFISEDPIGLEGGDTNLYAYVFDDPITEIDPLGLAVELPDWHPCRPLPLAGRKPLMKRILRAVACSIALTPPGGGLVGPGRAGATSLLGRPGSRRGIIELPGGPRGASDVFDKLARGGTATGNPKYPGIQIRQPDGTVVGLRTSGESATIDLHLPGQQNIKIKFPVDYVTAP